MATLIKKGRKNKAEAASAGSEGAGHTTEMAPVDGAPVDGGAPAAQAPAPMAQAPQAAAPAPTYQAAAGYTPPDGADDFQLPARHVPAEPPPLRDPGTGTGSLLHRALLFTGEQTAAERDRQAAADWEQAIAPVMDLMKASVPEASTPEEAARILAENQGEVTPDPMGGAYVQGDGFDRDARVYYRLLRRDYEKYPRPSDRNKRQVSHHLHQVYGKLVGTKGW
jgi:hypothetical protein